MGTEISLTIAGMPISQAKNARGPDHGFLFQESDCQRLRSDQIDYDAIDSNDPELPELERGFSRALKLVVPRLELLGYTMKTVEAEYESIVSVYAEEQRLVAEDSGEAPPQVMSFEEFRRFVADVTIEHLDDTFVTGSDDEDKRIRGRFNDETLKTRIPYYSPYDRHAYSERSYFGSLVEFLHPYVLLRLLAENKENLDALLQWDYGLLVSNGWAEEREFQPQARRRQTYLIATEGSSDTHILKRAFQLLRPDVADFFRFIDVSERHPFSGTGSLVNFAEGLAKIDVQNRIVFLLDNDAEGQSAFKKIKGFSLPVNMRAMVLPALDAFKSFPTTGPEGVALADINGRAASIECYLDLCGDKLPSPVVRWTNYKEDVGVYHGSLQHKGQYSKAFFELAGRNGYDLSKLQCALNAIVGVCTELSEEMLDGSDEESG